MKLERYESYRKKVDKALADRFSPTKDGADGLREAMRYSLQGGGKRLRPVLCLEFSRILGGDVDKTLPVACAVEMLHTYSLIHDDLPCMDNDDVRRGRPSCHVAFGESNAVLAGDCLQAEAFAAICAAPLSAARQAKCCALLSQAAGLNGICAGQYEDLDDGAVKTDLRVYARMMIKKTAVLFGASCAMGAITAGADDTQTQAALNFGIALGKAFQLRDDLLDGDGFCAVAGAEECQKMTEFFTQKAIELLDDFFDTGFLCGLVEKLAERQA